MTRSAASNLWTTLALCAEKYNLLYWQHLQYINLYHEFWHLVQRKDITNHYPVAQLERLWCPGQGANGAPNPRKGRGQELKMVSLLSKLTHFTRLLNAGNAVTPIFCAPLGWRQGTSAPFHPPLTPLSILH